MTLPLWGQLEKSSIDDETIEEAVERIIAEHNDDPEAHVQAGGSLEAHKADDVIDHPAESVLADKLAGFIDPDSEVGFMNDFTNSQSAFSGDGSVFIGFRKNRCQSSGSGVATSLNYSELGSFPSSASSKVIDILYLVPALATNPNSEVIFRCYTKFTDHDQGQSSWFEMGFRFLNRTSGNGGRIMYGYVNSSDGVEEVTLSTGFSGATLMLLSCELIGVTINFYIDNVLIDSISVSGFTSPGDITYFVHSVESPSDRAIVSDVLSLSYRNGY